MRMHLDLVGESSWQLLDDGLSIRPGIYADVVALWACRRTLHSVRPWAADRCRARDRADLSGEGAGSISSCRSRSATRLVWAGGSKDR